MNKEPEDMIQVVMIPALIPHFKEWLGSRGLTLAGPIPPEIGGDPDDLPTYFIGITDALMDDTKR